MVTEFSDIFPQLTVVVVLFDVDVVADVVRSLGTLDWKF